MLIGFIGLVGSHLDAGLGARVGVFDRLAVGSGQIIELVNAVANRFGLPLHISLAGERVHASPETFAAGRLQGLLAGGGIGGLGGCDASADSDLL